MHRPDVAGFYDPRTCSIQYVVSDPRTRKCAVIDPVLDFDIRTGKVETRSADAIVAAAEAASRRIVAILETHAHADHLSAALHLKARTGAPIAIGERIRDVQRIFKPMFGADDLAPDGRAFICSPNQTSLYIDVNANAGTGAYTTGPVQSGPFRDYSCSVMYQPGKVLAHPATKKA